MKQSLLLTFLTCLSVTSFSQAGLSLKLYQNSDIFKTRITSGIGGPVTNESQFNFSRLSLAVDLQTKKGFVHQVEFFIPELSKPPGKLMFPFRYHFIENVKWDGMADTYSIRYELSKYVAGLSDRFNFLVGAGINPYYIHLEYTPNVDNYHYTSYRWYGFALNVTPGLNYQIDQRFSIDMSAPIRLYTFSGENRRIDNPILPLRQQRRNQIKHYFFESVYTIRLGLRYSLSNGDN